MGGAPADPRPGRRPRARPRLRLVLLASMGALYLISVPWYRDADSPLRVVLGLPDWVAVAVLCYAGVAVLNAIAWWFTDVDDAGRLPPGLGERSEPIRSTRPRPGDPAGSARPVEDASAGQAERLDP